MVVDVNTSISLDHIANRIGRYKPILIEQVGFRQASVALILRQENDASEILFIQRATSERDRWSGQIAFPGGGKETYDSTLEQAAIRETQEEVGVVLDSQLALGRLDDIKGRNNNHELSLVVSCFVFNIEQHQTLMPNYEVAEAFWTPITQITDLKNHFSYQTTYQDEPFPAINLGVGNQGQERILWGLTYRFIEQFIAQIDSV